MDCQPWIYPLGPFARISQKHLIETMNIQNTIASINTWHTLARPNPDDKAFQVQLGCHFEEIAEQLETIKGNQDEMELHLQHAFDAMHTLATYLKGGELTVTIRDRKGFVDAIADQVVTGIGVAYCAQMNAPLAIERVDISNWSKFVNGKPEFNKQGKIAKPKTYKEPDLEGCY